MSSVDLKNHRVVSIDCMRATLAYLGIILHAAFIIILYDNFQNKNDPISIYFLSFITTFIHSFRIEIFFLIAGYFFAYQVSNRSFKNYISNRLKSIATPLLVIYGLTKVPTLIDFIFLQIHTIEIGSNQDLVSPQIIHNALIQNLDQLSYLWFLYFLLLYYILTLIIIHIGRLTNMMNKKIKLGLYWVINNRYSLLILSLLTSLITAHNFNIELHLSSTWRPEVSIFLFYYVFFIVGWLVFKTNRLWSSFQRNCQIYSILGIFFLVIIFADQISHTNFLMNANKKSSLSITILYNFMAWLFTFSIIGLFTYIKRPNKYILYLSQSSYWVYLSHFPILLLIIPIMTLFLKNNLIIFVISTIITTIIVLSSYHFFVRSTWIGKLLNGKRYKKSLKYNSH